ncbi:MAG: bacteriohemerythrin [Thermodesulfobacteriota bacterium]
MKKLQRLQWKDQYSVGFDELDSQHRKLIETINKAMDFYEDPSASVMDVFIQLSDYLGNHFMAEENIMAAMRYPALQAHGANHKDFNKKFMELLNAYENGDEKLALKLLLFLRDWFLNHVVTNDDPGYAQYYKRLQEKAAQGKAP